MDFKSKEEAIKDGFVSFEDKTTDTLPKELIITQNKYDPIGTTVKLLEVQGDYCYYAKLDGSSSKFFPIHIDKLINDIGVSYFIDKYTLKHKTAQNHSKAIDFINKKLVH